jgi:hypothetical protein
LQRLLKENLILRATQNKKGVGYRDGMTKPQRRAFAHKPQIQAALGPETTHSLPICESCIPPSIQLFLFCYVLTEEDGHITPEMLFEFTAQSTEFFEQRKVTRQIDSLRSFLQE